MQDFEQRAVGLMAERGRRLMALQRGDGDLFLISLKEGGFGLNLTAADYEVIVDPWWNTAAEDQAIGRAHHIGLGARARRSGKAEVVRRDLCSSKLSSRGGRWRIAHAQGTILPGNCHDGGGCL